jgi:prepilin-type processing-associated H-X9-DG protein
VEGQPVDFVINGWERQGATSGGRSRPLKITSVRRSSEIILFLDANRNRRVDSYVRHDVWQPDHLPGGGDVRVLDNNDRRHRGFCNVAYVDGHVAAVAVKLIKVGDFTAQ